MAAYILAFDQGTTSSRTILYDSHARALISFSKEFTQYYPAGLNTMPKKYSVASWKLRKRFCSVLKKSLAYSRRTLQRQVLPTKEKA